MQTVARSNFITVKTEGGILPAELLQRIADGEVDGLNPTDYHLAASERLNEAINRSWNRLLGVWQAFQHKMEQAAPSETGTTMTRDWLLTLLQELGYGRLPYQGKLTIGDTDYPISHLYDHTPIHLVTFQQKLDSPDRSQAIKRSPHSLLQECLNRSDTYLWGFVSNGLRLRILRDNISLTRVAYVEFDLEAMFQGELYADFTLLWLLCHQSRVEVGGAAVKEREAEDEAEPLPAARPLLPSDCWLEHWSQQAAEQGTRALDALRDGVQEAIAALGRGFLAHPANHQLKDDLRNGALTTQDYYRQLLRLVYRLLFLFVAEDRDLLLLPGTPPSVRQQYDAYYSVSRLRRLAETRRGGPHPDLYNTLARLSALLRTGYEPLGLPGLGSFLFSERATSDLDTAQIANQDLLTAVRALAFTVEGKVRRPVDYKNLGPEELGSVYESLLELHPKMHVPSASFSLDVAAGSERKTTGSYYTHASLIQSLLDSALEPVVADRLQQAGKGLRRYGDEWQAACEKALLDIKMVDPAAGSGHFLIAAARRLARHLARVRTGDDEPGPDAVRHALRDVVGHCIHGVDINEMAAELCKVALWMETLDPGRPLSFLDRKIRPGNSLIGATPALLHGGISDNAFNPITGDDKSYCSEWKKQNKAQQNQETLFTADLRPWQRLQQVAADMRQVDSLDDNTLTGVQQQEATYYELRLSPDYLDSKLWADAWCAAFVWIKAHDTFEYPITEDVFRRIGSSPDSTPVWLKKEIDRLHQEYQFFHWHLEFPQVFQPKDDLGDPNDVTGWEGGFDVVLGNPPWEQIEIDSEMDNKIRRLIAATQHFLTHSKHYPLTGSGRKNLYALFTESAESIVASNGKVGLILPTGIVTDSPSEKICRYLITQRHLISLFDFENTNERFFKGVHPQTKFSLTTFQPNDTGQNPIFGFFLDEPLLDVLDTNRVFRLSPIDIAAMSPSRFSVLVFTQRKDAELATLMYQNGITLKQLAEEGRTRILSTLVLNFDDYAKNIKVDLSESKNSSSNIVWRQVYEGSYFYRYDHRYAVAQHGEVNYATVTQKSSPTWIPSTSTVVSDHDCRSRWKELERDRDWYIGLRRQTNVRNVCTSIAAILPLSLAEGSVSSFYGENLTAPIALILCANLNTPAFDYITRMRMSGRNFNKTIYEQIPLTAVLKKLLLGQQIQDSTRGLLDVIKFAALEMTYTAYDLHSFAVACRYYGPPFQWSEERRFWLNCEIDAAFFHFYGINQEDIAYLMDTFDVLKNRDLREQGGEYRTKRVVLEIYNEMAEAMQSGKPYQTRLDPPPAHPDAAHPWDQAYLGPELPRDQWWREVDQATAQLGDRVGEIASRPTTSAADRVMKEPAPTLEFKSPPTPQPKPKTNPTPSLSVQPALITDFSPPKGGRSQRLKTVMGLGQPKNQAELQALVGALADEDSSIRWLAGSSLTRLGGLAVVNMLAAFLQSRPGETARQEALKVLELIADTDGDERVQERARKAMQSR